MSQTLQITRWNVQQILGDNNPDRRSVSPLRMDQIIKGNAISMFGRILRPRDSITNVTLVAGTYDYSLSGETGAVTQVFLNSNGNELAPMDFESFNTRYRQETNQPATSGTPGEYTLWEGTNNALRIRVGPTPSAADTLKVHRSSMPSFSSPPADADSIPYAADLLRALEWMSVADCIDSLSDEQLEILHMGRGAAQTWRSKSEKALRDYNVRASANGYRQDRVIRSDGRWGTWR